jgi:hypothetical protein
MSYVSIGYQIYVNMVKKTKIHGHKPANVGSPCKNKHRATYLTPIAYFVGCEQPMMIYICKL